MLDGREYQVAMHAPDPTCIYELILISLSPMRRFLCYVIATSSIYIPSVDSMQPILHDFITYPC